VQRRNCDAFEECIGDVEGAGICVGQPGNAPERNVCEEAASIPRGKSAVRGVFQPMISFLDFKHEPVPENIDQDSGGVGGVADVD
jgi:hypothetical protein